MATGRVNVSGGTRLNIFTQLNAPASKEGIWLQCNETFKNVLIDNRWWRKNTWIESGRQIFKDVPYDSTYPATVCLIDDIYAFPVVPFTSIDPPNT